MAGKKPWRRGVGRGAAGGGGGGGGRSRGGGDVGWTVRARVRGRTGPGAPPGASTGGRAGGKEAARPPAGVRGGRGLTAAGAAAAAAAAAVPFCRGVRGRGGCGGGRPTMLPTTYSADLRAGGWGGAALEGGTTPVGSRRWGSVPLGHGTRRPGTGPAHGQDSRRAARAARSWHARAQGRHGWIGGLPKPCPLVGGAKITSKLRTRSNSCKCSPLARSRRTLKTLARRRTGSWGGGGGGGRGVGRGRRADTEEERERKSVCVCSCLVCVRVRVCTCTCACMVWGRASLLQPPAGAAARPVPGGGGGSPGAPARPYHVE
jgi:hypothetical protein